ncbi:MAG: MEDS domain-containing protein [Nitrososphaera sp.]|jgi:CheY-like chemotaxis protein
MPEGGDKEQQMTSLVSPARPEHVMLLYDSDNERNIAAAHCIDEGLRNNRLCVYASVGALDSASKWHTSRISSMITDFEENVRKGNLVVVDLKPFFESAQKGSLASFWQLKIKLERLLNQKMDGRRGDRVLVFADAACTLSESGQFEECVALESWWQSVYQGWKNNEQNITVICPHPSRILNMDSKDMIASVHTLTLHLDHYKRPSMQSADGQHNVGRHGARRALISESNPDMKYLYSRYLSKMGFDVMIVDNSTECLDRIFSNGDAGFDLIIMDANSNEYNIVEVARKIKEKLPDKRIVVTTTSIADAGKSEPGIDIITKPFSLSKLLASINP